MVLAGSVPLPPLGDHELLLFWCQLLVLLFSARLGGYALRLIGQPRVVGELLAGMVLGPSVLGQVWPRGWEWLFPEDARQAGLLLGLAWFGIALLLVTTGAETDLASIKRQGRVVTTTAIGSLLVPFGAGVGVGWLLPKSFVGSSGTATFSVFIGVALAISSLPVAARILSDLGLLNLPIGQLVLAVAMTNDVIGWILLGVLAGVAEDGSVSIGGVLIAVVGVVFVTVVTLTLGPRFLDQMLLAVGRREGGPAASLSIVVLFAVAVGAITHAIGLEVVIGAFLAGIAIGRSRLIDTSVREHLEITTAAVFAPLFFAVAGLRVDLTALADPSVVVGVVVVVVVATATKLLGSYAGARVGGLSRSDAFSVGAALNARGALEVVVATVGLSIGVLNRSSYTAVVVMAIITSASTGPLLRIGGAKRT
ncbi:MAG: cation:proton antiporter [Ilumatobacteraceae bacterium]